MSNENKPKPIKFFRLTPQLKTFKQGVVLKTKQDLYYTLEEDIVDTGGEDSWSPFASLPLPAQAAPGVANPSLTGQAQNAPGALPAGAVPVVPHQSFNQSSNFIHKEATVMFVEAAQFRAADNRVYVRLQLIDGEKIVWINLLRVPQSVWGYKIRSEQKKMIKDEISKMFDLLIE